MLSIIIENITSDVRDSALRASGNLSEVDKVPKPTVIMHHRTMRFRPVMIEAIVPPDPPSKEEKMENQVSSISLIPGDLRSRYSGDEVIEAGWAAGPSFIVRKTNRYSRPVTLSDACG